MACALTVALLSGCGGGGNGETTAGIDTNSLSKAEYIDRANAICVKYHEQVDKAIQRSAASQDKTPTARLHPAHLAQVIESIAIPAGRAESRALRALGAPRGFRSEVEAMLVAFDNAIEEAEAALEERSAANPQDKSTNPGSKPFPEHYKAAELAQKLGLDQDCTVL